VRARRKHRWNRRIPGKGQMKPLDGTPEVNSRRKGGPSKSRHSRAAMPAGAMYVRPHACPRSGRERSASVRAFPEPDSRTLSERSEIPAATTRFPQCFQRLKRATIAKSLRWAGATRPSSSEILVTGTKLRGRIISRDSFFQHLSAIEK